MPADIVSDILQQSQQREAIVFMDDYGCTSQLYIAVSQATSRTTIISDQQASIVALETATLAMATAAGMTMPAPMTLAQKMTAWNQMQAGTYVAPMISAPPPSTVPSSTT